MDDALRWADVGCCKIRFGWISGFVLTDTYDLAYEHLVRHSR